MKGETMRRYTKAMRRADLLSRLESLGFTRRAEQFALLRIERTLQRWGERECGNDHGCIERDEETGKPYWISAFGERMKARTRLPVRDLEAGAVKRLARIMAQHPGLRAYHQGDCRGCNLYILRAQDIQDGETIDSVYTRGLAVCD